MAAMAMASQTKFSYLVLSVFVVLFAILVCIEQSEGLTAFGKSPTSNTGQDENKKPKAKPKGCTTDDDCRVTSSNCTYNQIEGKKYCMCPDGSVPDNGKCRLKGLAPGQECTPGKCAPGSDCLLNRTLNKKICVCEEGYFDDNTNANFRFCNGASVLFLPDAASLLLGTAVFGAFRVLLQSH